MITESHYFRDGSISNSFHTKLKENFMERVKTNPLPTNVEIIDLSDKLDIRRLKELTDADVKRLRKYL